MVLAELKTDHAVRGILLANAATLAFALWQEWSVLQLMWPFWAQSLIIGWYARRRMLKLESFCTDGMKINDQPVEPTPATLRATANFFALHYGGFHLIYCFFLLAMTFTTDANGYIEVTNESSGEEYLVYIGHIGPFDLLIFAALAWGYVRAHGASHREHVEADLAHTRKLGSLMMIPYLRILPMHLTIILAFAVGGGALWLFILMKIATDVAMHKIEHGMLQRGPSPS
jgi:hypothetical protein